MRRAGTEHTLAALALLPAMSPAPSNAQRLCGGCQLADVHARLPLEQPALQVPDTQLYEIEPFVASMKAVPKSGMHNPLKDPERSVVPRRWRRASMGHGCSSVQRLQAGIRAGWAGAALPGVAPLRRAAKARAAAQRM